MLRSGLRLLGDGPHGVDDAGEVAQEGEDEADPELNLQPQPTNIQSSIDQDQPAHNSCNITVSYTHEHTLPALQQAVRKPPPEEAELDSITYPAAELEEDPERREDDGEDDVDAGRRAVRHLATCLCVPLPFIRSSWRALQARTPSIDGGRQRARRRISESRRQACGGACGGECDELRA